MTASAVSAAASSPVRRSNASAPTPNTASTVAISAAADSARANGRMSPPLPSNVSSTA